MKIDISKIIPHKSPMILIDDIVSYDETHLVSSLTITEKSFCFANGSVPAWVGIEYMAQTIAAYSGQCLSDGSGKPEIGFLVSVRGFESQIAHFKLGETLLVTVNKEFIHDNAGNFTCSIAIGSKTIAEAVITTYKAPSEFIAKLKERL